MPKISIIIPVYNVEKYIENCLKSLENQTMQDFEIIIVNDGSKDNCEQIIKNYQKTHSKMVIKYFKKENGGLASARNYGVKYSKGEYISFLDPDDYLDNRLYEKLKPYMEQKIDMIKFKMKTINEDGKNIEELNGPTFETCTGEEAYENLCTQDNFLDPACIYLYRRKFFVENNFQYRLTYHEDFGLTSLIMIKAKSVVSTEIYGYYYLQTQNSLTRDNNYEKDKARAKDMLSHYDYMQKVIKNYQVQEKTKEYVRRYYTNSVVLKAKTLKGKEQEEYIEEIKKRKMYKNIKPYNIKQLIKRLILMFNVKLYLKIR